MQEAQLAWVLIAALAGVLAGGGGVFVVLSRANKSVELKDSTEKLLASLVPQETLQEVSLLAHRAFDVIDAYGERVRQAGLDAAEFISDVTDQQPNS